MIGDKLKEVMRLQGLNQVDIYRKTGISQSVISTWINGERQEVMSDNLRRLCKGLNVSADYLLELNEANQYINLIWEFQNAGVGLEELRELLEWVKKIKKGG